MESATRSRRTPLYAAHLAAGARMVDFAGWLMPVQYEGILGEHRAVRRSAGIFDISHMGEFMARGSGACSWLDSLFTNRVAKLGVDEAQYTLMLNEAGGVIDDLIAYRIGDDEFLLVVNAAKIEVDEAWMRAHPGAGAELENQSDCFAAMAIQGPRSPEIFRSLFSREMPSERNRVVELSCDAGRMFAATTGYTGEIGFEVVLPAPAAEEMWSAALAAGAAPCGLGARDTLRLEACYPLNGSDLSPARTPLEAGLKAFVDLGKDDFIGKGALDRQLKEGIPTRLAAIRVEEKSPPIRSHYPVWIGGRKAGETSSGALSPTLGCGIAMAYLPASIAKPGEPVEIEIRGRRYKARIHRKPIYARQAN